MQIFIGWIVGGFLAAAASFVGRFLISLGIGYVTYQGLDILLTGIQTQIFINLNNPLPEVNAALNMLNIGKCINVTFSAIIARNLLNGLTGGSITKAVIK